MPNGILLSQKEWDHVICRKLSATRDYHVEQGKSGLERHVFSYLWITGEDEKVEGHQEGRWEEEWSKGEGLWC